MATLEAISLMGCSGRSYPFTVHPIGAPLAATGAVYALLHDGPIEPCLTKRSVLGMDPRSCRRGPQWTVLYVGHTDDIRERFALARLEWELVRIRATHLAVLRTEDVSQRRCVESDLVPRYATLLPPARCSRRAPLVESITIAPYPA